MLWSSEHTFRSTHSRQESSWTCLEPNQFQPRDTKGKLAVLGDCLLTFGWQVRATLFLWKEDIKNSGWLTEQDVCESNWPSEDTVSLRVASDIKTAVVSWEHRESGSLWLRAGQLRGGEGGQCAGWHLGTPEPLMDMLSYPPERQHRGQGQAGRQVLAGALSDQSVKGQGHLFQARKQSFLSQLCHLLWASVSSSGK